MKSGITPSKGFKDTPIAYLSEETLGLKEYAEALSDFVLFCDTPMTIALQGDWGSGKTSLMNLIRAQVCDPEEKVRGVWFNTWQYSQFSQSDELPLSLLSYFIDQVVPEKESSKIKSSLNVLRMVGKVTANLAVTRATGDSSAIKNTADLISSNEYSDPSTELTKLKSQLSNLIEKQTKHERIIVFIDDLDRLVPIKAVELLESLKLFLDLKNCVFLLACDYNVVVQGLKEKFNVSEAELKGKSFFDKIIQVPFNMPLTQYRIDIFLRDLLSRLHIECSDTDLRHYEGLIQKSVGFNPRSMKRIFNSLLLLQIVARKKQIFDKLAGHADKDEVSKILLAILCLQHSYSEMYEFLANAGSDLDAGLFDDLRDSDQLANGDKFEDWRRELAEDVDPVYFQRLADFMFEFFNVLQLKSDTEDTGNKMLSAGELDSLRSILSFSAVVSATTSVRAPQQKMSEDEFMEDLEESETALFKEIFDHLKKEGINILMGTKGFSIKDRHGKAIVHCYPSTARRKSQVVTRDHGDEYRDWTREFLGEFEIKNTAFSFGSKGIPLQKFYDMVHRLDELSEKEGPKSK